MCTKDITLKAASADTFYYPPEWKPSRGTLDEFQQKRGYEHYFGKSRTKNLHKGVLQIRFELPFKVQCLRCSKFLGQGTRYDADKKTVGKYFSTSLFQFEFRCGEIVDPKLSADHSAHCNQRLVIRTDPENDDYALTEGLRRVVGTWDAKDTETMELVDPETRNKMNDDPMFKTEKLIRDKQKEKSDKERLADLEDLQADREDYYALNCAMRRTNRIKRKEEKAQEEAERLAGKPNFALPLAAVSDQDAAEAKAITFRTDHDRIELSVRRAAIRAEPLFGEKKSTAIVTASSSKTIRAEPLLGKRTSTAIVKASSSKEVRLPGKFKASSASSSGALQELVAKRRRVEQHARMAALFQGPVALS